MQRILDAAFTSVATQGLRQLTLSQVCRTAGVARGTLYRYFPTREGLLEALGDLVRQRFERGLAEVLAEESLQGDPMQRLDSVARFLNEYANQIQGVGLLRAEPLFVLSFLARHVDDYALHIERALVPLFDQVEIRLGSKVDRKEWAQIIVRCNFSLYLLPASGAGGAQTLTPLKVLSWLLAPHVLGTARRGK